MEAGDAQVGQVAHQRVLRRAERTERINSRRKPARKLPPVSVPRGAPRPAPDNRLKRALRAANDRDRLMVMLAAYAG
jgi:hypothetical protein